MFVASMFVEADHASSRLPVNRGDCPRNMYKGNSHRANFLRDSSLPGRCSDWPGRPNSLKIRYRYCWDGGNFNMIS
jgi:hypothetical protein